MEDAKRASRRPHRAELKAQVLAECSQPGVSVAKVAMAHGLNANLVHKWRRVAGAVTTRVAALADSKGCAGGFIALAVPPQAAPSALPDIRIELRRGATTVSIHWPVQGGGDCAAWLRQWL